MPSWGRERKKRSLIAKEFLGWAALLRPLLPPLMMQLAQQALGDVAREFWPAADASGPPPRKFSGLIAIQPASPQP